MSILPKEKIVIVQCIDFTQAEAQQLKRVLESMSTPYTFIITPKRIEVFSDEDLKTLLERLYGTNPSQR